jgi:hypothetical protein
MNSASWALQQAVYARLESNDTVRDSAGIYDAVPRSAAFPYIVVGEAGETALDDADSEHALAIRIWSRAGGHRECKEVAAAVRDTLDRAELTLDGHSLIDLRFLTADYDRDGETFRAVLRFRAVTEEQ